jgi:urease accessory protein
LALRPPLILALAGIAVFGLAHGHAHGAEGPGSGLLVYGAGFALATMSLHLVGLAVGMGLVQHERMAVARGLGGAVFAGGLVLAAGWA